MWRCSKKSQKTVPSAGEADGNWNSHGIMPILDYLKNRKTINGEYYAELMNDFKSY